MTTATKNWLEVGVEHARETQDYEPVLRKGAGQGYTAATLRGRLHIGGEMDKNEALVHWLRQAFKAGQISVRLERAIETQQVTLSEALRILDRVLEEAAMPEAPQQATYRGRHE